ncbi:MULTISPECIES: ATP-binding cassette domain-containing protein [unclassified Streptomyces]|uniref:ATP-binding cassette domain-containing protein n=1 Tax=unclassified Streptomyces TaxID=2593676 RepID=UPI0033D7EA41
MTLAIEVEGLVKCFGAHRALDGVDLAVPAGQILGLLGPNGAGKTTTVRVLATLLRPDAGRARVFGYDVAREPHQVRRCIALTGQFASVDGNISGRENLYLIARLLGVPARRARQQADGMLERFRLGEAGGKPAREYSGGMRRRLDLAASLMGEPRLIYLDEPTTGLDPHSRNELWTTVKERALAGSTVLLTTQYMEEAEALADSVVVVDKGRVIAAGTAAELRARVGGRTLEIRPAYSRDLAALAGALALEGLEGRIDQEACMVRLPLVEPDELTRAVRAVTASAVEVLAVDTRVASLDEAFIELTRSTP